MDNDNVKTLCSHLKQEISWIEMLNALLVEEKNLLEQRQYAQLEEFANKKQEISHKIEESARARVQLINNSGQINKDILSEFLQGYSEIEINEVNNLNQKLAEKLSECRELNTVNGQVIANNLYVRQEIVSALSGNNAEGVSVYNAHGSLTSANDQKHHNQA